MNKNRLEAFSDGVFAIVITLLVLDIRVPQVEYSQLGHAIYGIYPKVISYVLSFTIIGVYWIGHHYYFRLIKKTNGVFTWLNILLLLLVSFIPFPTSLLGEYPFRTIPVLIYGLNLLAVNILSAIMLYYVYRRPDLAEEGISPKNYTDFFRLFWIVNIIYLIAVVISPAMPKVSYCIYIAALPFLVVVYARRGD